LIENFNFLQKINISENPTVSMMITHPEGIIFLFFSNYALYYKYDIEKKKLIPQNDKKVTYTDRKFINYAIIDEKNYKYFISDEFGNLFIMALIPHYNNEQINEQFVLQILGEINYSTCMVYLDNNYLFNGSNKADSQLIKIENNSNSLINIVKSYESLSPIKDFILINNMEEENAIEFLTISGWEKNCAIKKIKKGSPVIFNGGVNIKNLKDVFKIDINNKENIYTLIITTILKTFILDYNYNTNEIFINNHLKLDNNELVIFAQNLEKFIIIVTNISIKIYNKNLDLILNKYLEEENKKIIPLIVKYSKKLSTLFIYSNNQNLVAFKFDINGNIIESSEILKNVEICNFDICKYFLVYALYDSNNLFIYSFNSKKIEIINIPDECLDYAKISSIQIFKHELFHYIFIALSTGKLIYFKLKMSDNNYDGLYTFSSNDFTFKRKYNLNVEDFTIKKIRQKNNNSLFINTQTPLFIHFNKENLVISYFNIKSCKNLIEIIDNQFLFIFKDKINFGTLLNIQSQNIISKFFGKQINLIKLISFKEENNKEEKNKSNDYILTIEENRIGNKFRNCLILNDINMKEISRFDFPYENEQSNTISEIKFKKNMNVIDSKLFIIGTSIIENISKETTKGHLYLVDIKQNNNYKFSKLLELETNGGIHKVITCQNFVYAAIGNILYIYKIKQLFDESYEIKQIKRCSDFTLINDIELLNESKNNYENNQSNNTNIITISNSEQYIIISDIGRSIGIYCFSLDDYKFSELYRDNSHTWAYSNIQFSDDTFYITDIEGNIISLRKNTLTKEENDPLKLEKIAYYNFGERINSMILTKIKNKDLFYLSNENNDYDSDDKVNIIFFVTLEGSLGQIIQINKEVYLFLEALQNFLLKKSENIGGFNYDNWKKFRNGMNKNESKGFIEGDLIENFLNNDEIYKKQILKDLDYNWNKQYDEIIHILETLVNNH
jgi:DNA damage-binding protein 1